MPSAERPTVTGSSALAVCHWLGEHGLDVQALAGLAGINVAALDQQDSRVELTAFNTLLQLAAKSMQNPALGLHLGAWTDSSRMGVIGHIVFNNRTLQQGLEQYQRLSELVNEGVRVSFEVGPELSVVSYECPDYQFYSALNIERMVSQAVTRARRFVSEKLFLREVGFAHERLAPQEEYDAVFGCPVLFGQGRTFIAFESTFLTFELPQRNPFLHQALTRHVEALLKKLQSRRKLSLQVRKILEKNLSRAVDVVQIADQLAMSRQTLYRKLKQEGVSFQELVEEVRQEKAMAYLNAGRYSLSEIAFLLGFSEQSAFSRAFKRWTGKSPAQFRK